MLQNRADIDKVDLNGDFALRLVCKFRNNYRSILIDKLLNKLVNINIANKRESTALISRYLTDAEIEELIIYNATINAVDLNNRSALYLTCKWQDNLLIIEAFLRNNIDSIIRDRQDYTARYYIEFVKIITDSCRRKILCLFRR